MNDVKALIERFRSEVMTAIWAFYTWKHINNVASNNAQVHRALNANAATWNAITHSLQSTFFITLGRIFDTDSGALSINSFLNKCQTEVAQFGKAPLTARKIKDAGGKEPEWLKDYVANAYEPRAEDFRALKRASKRHKAKYEAIYKPIRNMVVAHKDIAALETTAALFEKTRIGDIEEILLFLHQIGEVVTQYFLNGRRSQLEDYAMNEEARITEDVEALLTRLGAQQGALGAPAPLRGAAA